jgi:glycosyltransferase involved in cell wall biosynthesis
MEYMAFGLPFVAFDLPETGAIAEGAAVFAPPGDVTGHAKHIDALLADPERRAALGSVGRLRVQEELAWDHQAVTYLQTVNELLERRAAADSLLRRSPGHQAAAGVTLTRSR